MSKYDFNQIEKLLRHFVNEMVSFPDNYSQEEGQLVDRALRTCPKFSDIDIIWIKWRYVGEMKGWLTDKELIRNKNGVLKYPEKN